MSKQLYKIFIQDLSLALVLTYLLSQVNRFTSKAFFEKKTEFPTVKMLLPSSSSMSPEFRKRIEAKVKADFKMALPNLEDEQLDLNATKTRIGEIVSLIIHKVKNGRLLLQHNIEYGFMRNLIGGSVIALLASLVSALYFYYVQPRPVAFAISLGFCLCYLLPILFSKFILNQYSNEYAKILFREYVGGKQQVKK